MFTSREAFLCSCVGSAIRNLAPEFVIGALNSFRAKDTHAMYFMLRTDANRALLADADGKAS